MRTPRTITIVGAGVIGLTCALALDQQGYNVSVIADSGPRVSDVAGGLWLPYRVGAGDEVLDWAMTTRPWLEERGARIVEYLHLERDTPWWLDALPAGDVRMARADELPAAHDRGWICRVPLVETPRHMNGLATTVTISRRSVSSLDEVSGLVVNCTGLRARELASDPAVEAARGQIVHIPPLGGVPCICDLDAMSYVLPRADVTVVGGSDEHGNESEMIDDQQSTEILKRATRLARIVHEAVAAPVVGAAGLSA